MAELSTPSSTFNYAYAYVLIQKTGLEVSVDVMYCAEEVMKKEGGELG